MKLHYWRILGVGEGEEYEKQLVDDNSIPFEVGVGIGPMGFTGQG